MLTAAVPFPGWHVHLDVWAIIAGIALLYTGAVRRERMLTVWVVALTFIIGIPMAWIIVKPFFEG